MWSTFLVTYFYPRSPRGERPDEEYTVEDALAFLSTLPARGATGQILFPVVYAVISIHAPREGSDPWAMPSASETISISIHAPREGSDADVVKNAMLSAAISIHAPREGSDPPGLRCLRDRRHISIHAPREGSDSIQVNP